MRSGLLNPPVAPATPVVPRALDRPPATRPIVVVAGLTCSGRSAAVDALVGPPPPAAPYVVYRWGERTAAVEHIPGVPKPRTAGSPPARTRPPRRVEITQPAELLRSLTLLDTPGAGDLDASGRDVVLDAAQHGAGLLFVAAAGARLVGAELDLLAEASQRGIPVVLALAGTGSAVDPDAMGANRTALRERAPAFADAGWVGTDPAALRQALLDLVAAAGAGTGAEERGAVGAVTVAAEATDERWREILDREIRVRRDSLLQRLAIDLATIHVRCVQEISSGRGCTCLPDALDRELHALSVRMTRTLDLAAHDIAGRVFAAVLDATPDPAVLRRILTAAGRAMDLRDGAVPEDRVLLLTSTSGAAVLSGRAALRSLSALPAEAAGRPPALRAVGVGLTAGCFLLWQQRTGADKREGRRWLQQAVHVVEVELQHGLNQRFADLREALEAIASDTVDHGVLLA